MSDIQLLSYPVSEVEPYIHWLYFFHAWGFPPRFATITSIHSCPSCRQGWISTFSDDELAQLLALARKGLGDIFRMTEACLGAR